MPHLGQDVVSLMTLADIYKETSAAMHNEVQELLEDRPRRELELQLCTLACILDSTLEELAEARGGDKQAFLRELGLQQTLRPEQ